MSNGYGGPRGGPQRQAGPGRGGGQWGPSGGEGFQTPSDQDLRAIIQEGKAETLVSVAEQVGRALAQGGERDRLSTSQIRGVFSAVRQIEMKWPLEPHEGNEAQQRAQRSQRQLLLLKPKLAYQAKRAQSRGADNLRMVLDPAISMVGGDRERFQNFVDFFEAILAYHRAYGGQ